MVTMFPLAIYAYGALIYLSFPIAIAAPWLSERKYLVAFFALVFYALLSIYLSPLGNSNYLEAASDLDKLAAAFLASWVIKIVVNRLKNKREDREIKLVAPILAVLTILISIDFRYLHWITSSAPVHTGQSETIRYSLQDRRDRDICDSLKFGNPDYTTEAARRGLTAMKCKKILEND